ncbi:hypothetical protein C8Q70DRAFT_1052007 [Cubamyces menziesii]|nr:hypothetical protein C8Q70DRAFT_1052007 [Cubamyces menziesii]
MSSRAIQADPRPTPPGFRPEKIDGAEEIAEDSRRGLPRTDAKGKVGDNPRKAVRPDLPRRLVDLQQLRPLYLRAWSTCHRTEWIYAMKMATAAEKYIYAASLVAEPSTSAFVDLARPRDLLPHHDTSPASVPTAYVHSVFKISSVMMISS